MRTVRRRPNETPQSLVRRCYTIIGPDGSEDPERLERALRAVRGAGLRPEGDPGEVSLPPVEEVPFLRRQATDMRDAELAVREGLRLVLNDERLMRLSFIDPLRVGSEELGIVGTRAIAAALRRRWAGLFSFDQERYAAVRDEPWEEGKRSPLRWIPGRHQGPESAGVAR